MRLIAIAILFLATPALAQQPQQPQQPQQAQQPSPNEQAMSAKLIREISDGLQCSGNLIATTQKLQAAEARVKELEDKYEKKPEKK